MTADELWAAAQDAFLLGLSSVDGTRVVQAAVRRGLLDDWLGDLERPNRIQVLAIGKAAPAMLWGLVEGGVPFRGFGVAPRGVRETLVDTFAWRTGDHPVPGEASLAAGRDLLAWVDWIDPAEPLLVLLSGGASACVEVPVDGVAPEELAHQWRAWLADGSDIQAMNESRAALSQLKGGRLGERVLRRLGPGQVQVWLLADTPDPAERHVGSAPFFGPGCHDIAHHVLASNTNLVDAAARALAAGGYEVFLHGERVAGRIDDEVASFLAAAEALPSGRATALVGGGEPTVALAPDSPNGGRAQHAALVAARVLARTAPRTVFMAAASDGKDGSTDAAGAWANARTWLDNPVAAAGALEGFDAHGYLDGRNQVIRTGNTRTNVNDVWIALRPGDDPARPAGS